MGTIIRIIIGLFVGVGGGILINKSTEAGGFEWIKDHLRITWVIYLILLSSLFFSDSNILEIAMNLYGKWNKTGYLVCFIFGGLLLCGYWYFAGIISKSAERKSKGTVPVEQLISPTAKEIASEVVRQFEKREQKTLANEFPEGFIIFGLMKPGEPLIKGFVPNGIEVDWNTGRVEIITDQNVSITLPNIKIKRGISDLTILEHSAVISRQTGFVANVGLRMLDLSFRAKVLQATEPVIIALGIVKEKEK